MSNFSQVHQIRFRGASTKSMDIGADAPFFLKQIYGGAAESKIIWLKKNLEQS